MEQINHSHLLNKADRIGISFYLHTVKQEYSAHYKILVQLCTYLKENNNIMSWIQNFLYRSSEHALISKCT